jgi:hypothetical protein
LSGKELSAMLHFTCDHCGQHLNDDRYVAKIEVFAAFDPSEISEQDLDADHLQDIASLIEDMELDGQAELEESATKQFRFDLCPECRKKFVNDPLGLETMRRLNFSEN